MSFHSSIELLCSFLPIVHSRRTTIACSFYCIHSLSHGLFFIHPSHFETYISSFQTTIFLVFLLLLTHLLFFYIFILQFCLHSFFLYNQTTSIRFFLTVNSLLRSIHQYSSFLPLSLLVLPHTRISTAFNLLLCFSLHTQLSLPHSKVGSSPLLCSHFCFFRSSPQTT